MSWWNDGDFWGSVVAGLIGGGGASTFVYTRFSQDVQRREERNRLLDNEGLYGRVLDHVHSAPRQLRGDAIADLGRRCKRIGAWDIRLARRLVRAHARFESASERTSAARVVTDEYNHTTRTELRGSGTNKAIIEADVRYWLQEVDNYSFRSPGDGAQSLTRDELQDLFDSRGLFESDGGALESVDDFDAHLISLATDRTAGTPHRALSDSLATLGVDTAGEGDADRVSEHLRLAEDVIANDRAEVELTHRRLYSATLRLDDHLNRALSTSPGPLRMLRWCTDRWRRSTARRQLKRAQAAGTVVSA